MSGNCQKFSIKKISSARLIVLLPFLTLMQNMQTMIFTFYRLSLVELLLMLLNLISSAGPQSFLYSGVHEQNYIPILMAYASCVGPFSEGKKPCADKTTQSAFKDACVSNENIILAGNGG